MSLPFRSTPISALHPLGRTAFLLLSSALWVACSASTLSYTGTLANPEDTVMIDLNLVAPGTVTLQTFGFGGGTNGAGASIPNGGFDPFVALFSGSGPTAVFLNGDSDVLSNYTPGCPPSGVLTIGSVPGQCGDVNLSFPGLTPGDYTVLLTDGEYLPSAVFEPSPGFLGDGFTDLTAGVFQTCFDTNNCNNDTANWALDISATDGSLAPEPGTAVLAIAGAAALLARRKNSSRGDSK